MKVRAYAYTEGNRMSTHEMVAQLRRQVRSILDEGISYDQDLLSMLASAYLQGALDARHFLAEEPTDAE